jgi:hypothetical protein
MCVESARRSSQHGEVVIADASSDLDQFLWILLGPMQRTIGIAVQDERAIEFKREIDRVATNPADSGWRFADRFLSNEHTCVR